MRHLSLPITALMLLGACSTSPALLDERRTEPHAGFLRRAAALPKRSVFLRAEDPGQRPLVMHAREVHGATPRRGPLVVLQPGILADHKTWRFLWPQLGERYDLLLIDPPGSGLSDKPRIGTLPPDGYSPAWLGRHTLRAVRTWQCHRGDQRRIVFVAHSLGSTSLVRALAEPRTRQEMPDLLARIDRLVLFALADVGMREVSPVFEELEGLSTPVVAAGNALGLVDAQVREGIRDAVAEPDRRAFRQEADRIAAIIRDDDMRTAAQQMLRRFRPLTPGLTPDWPRIRYQQAQHSDVRLPILLLWGAQDKTLPPAMGRDVAAQLPGARLELVPGSMHSPHQELPAFCFARVVRFIERGT